MALPTQIAETVQTAHIQQHPSPSHDLNPSTAASKQEPVTATPLRRNQTHHHKRHDDESIDEDDDDDYDIPISVLRPRDRGYSFPPMPDLRFEQSYLHSIQKADRWWKVLWITARDQMMMPFVQGVLWNLAVFGWQHWNRNAQFHGRSVGATLRRWWYAVNGWPIPKAQ